jgi:hypothetical protein
MLASYGPIQARDDTNVNSMADLHPDCSCEVIPVFETDGRFYGVRDFSRWEQMRLDAEAAIRDKFPDNPLAYTNSKKVYKEMRAEWDLEQRNADAK